MSESSDVPSLRIGVAERDSAMRALDEHLSAGRLNVQEYADRSAVAAGATVAAELAALFTDLPQPHPDLGGSQVSLATSVGTGAPAGRGTVATRSSGFLDSWGGRIVAVAPIAALVLFLVFHVWWVWLLIPAAGALFHGGHHDDRDRRRE